MLCNPVTWVPRPIAVTSSFWPIALWPITVVRAPETVVLWPTAVASAELIEPDGLPTTVTLFPPVATVIASPIAITFIGVTLTDVPIPIAFVAPLFAVADLPIIMPLAAGSTYELAPMATELVTSALAKYPKAVVLFALPEPAILKYPTLVLCNPSAEAAAPNAVVSEALALALLPTAVALLFPTDAKPPIATVEVNPEFEAERPITTYYQHYH